MAEVSRKPNHDDVRITCMHLFQQLRCLVARSVVDIDDLIALLQRAQHLCQLLVTGMNALLLVVTGNDDAEGRNGHVYLG